MSHLMMSYGLEATENCAAAPTGDDGLFATGFTLVETASDSGVFSW